MRRRLLRFYGKKRGERRTGSQRLGSYGEAVFYAALLLLGTATFYLLLTRMILPEWQANRHFVPGQCVVTGKAIGTIEVEGRDMHRPELLIKYESQGNTYKTWTYDINQHLYPYSRSQTEEILAQFETGQTYACWYDPSNPERVVLVRGYSWWLWLLLILPASFVVVGLVGTVRALLQTGTSAERRAAMAQRAAHLDLFDEAPEQGQRFPSIPSLTPITDSPGTQLAYRLPTDAAPGWNLAGVLLICVLWNSFVLWFALANLHGHLVGEGDWWTTLGLLPFAAAGVVLVWYAVRQVLMLAGLGSTRIEVSNHPLVPGHTYQLYLTHSGRLRRKWLEVSLICQEKATYRQGTDTRVEKVAVYEQTLLKAGPAGDGQPGALEESCDLHVPEAAMHSFLSSHNEIKWHLAVRSEMERGQVYHREFPVIVHPPDDRRNRP